MSIDTQSTGTGSGTGRSPADPQHDLSVLDLFGRLYALFYNKRFGLLVILAMAAITLVGVLFPQAPDGVLATPASRASWLDTLRPRYGGWTDLLAGAGIFSVFSSPLFVAIAVVLALSIIACTTHRLPQLYARAFTPHTHVRDSFFDHARVSETTVLPVDAEAASARLKDALLARRFRILSDPDGTPRYADRHRLAPFGTALAHAAFVVILAGVLVTSLFGYRVDDLSVPVGSRVDVRGTNLAIEARAFLDSYNADGSASDYVSDLVLYADGQQVAEQREVRVNAPLSWGGWTINQASFGIAADLEVRDAAGAVIPTSGIPLSFRTPDGRYAYGRVDLPDQQLRVYLITPASGQVVDDIAPGQAQIEVYATSEGTTPDGARPTFNALLNPGTPVEGAGLSWTFVRERQYTGLMVSSDPGAPIVWIGCALLVIGTCWTMFWRHQRLWLRLASAPEGTQVSVASPDRHDVTFARSVRTLVAGLGDADRN